MMGTRRATAAALAAAVLAVAAAIARAEELRVDTALGAVVGRRHEEKGIESFFGLPYAQQPVGELRWQPPQPLTG